MKTVFFILLLFTLLSSFVYAKDNYVIVPGVRVGIITASTTESDLVKLYGIENVQSQTSLNDQYEMTRQTILFPFDFKKRIQIFWAKGNSHTGPELVRIEGTNSLWHTNGGIFLGMSLSQLESMNGIPLHLTGFHPDYPGIITDCGYGKLKFLGFQTPEGEDVYGRLMTLRLYLPIDNNALITKEELQSISGPGIYSSDNEIMKKCGPVVKQMDITFLKEDQIKK